MTGESSPPLPAAKEGCIISTNMVHFNQGKKQAPGSGQVLNTAGRYRRAVYKP